MVELLNDWSHLENSDLGFDMENIIYFPVKGDISAKYNSLKNELEQHPNILSVTSSTHLPFLIGNGIGNWGIESKFKNL